VVTSMTPLVEYGAEVGRITTQYAQELETFGAIAPATLADLSADPTDQAAAAQAVEEISAGLGVDAAEAAARLEATSAVPAADLAFVQEHGEEVAAAAAATADEWRTWWWICVAGEVLFIPFVFLMAGRWSPRRARQDALEHERRVQEELRALQTQS